MIVEDPQKGVIVPELTEYVVKDPNHILKLILEGNKRRTMAATGMNKFSSRSHAILQISVQQRNKVRDTVDECLYSKFLLVDLAGSERGGLEKGIRTHEGSNINKSLLSLGNCINILSDPSKKGSFIPYRDSKLTRLLKDSLGGNIMTVMIACVSPSWMFYDETINTLKYATRARKIQKKIKKNVLEVEAHISQYKDIIDNLKHEISQLNNIIKTQNMMLHSNQITITNSPRQANFRMKNEGEVLSRKLSTDYLKDKSKTFISSYDFDKKKKFKMENNLDEDDEEDDLILLEKEVEILLKEKLFLEEKIQFATENDTNITEKYKEINGYYEKIIDQINKKLIQNLEQNMVLKCNLREIIDLNQSNNNTLNALNNQLYQLEKSQLEKSFDMTTIGENEISKLRDEIKNIHKAIEENEEIKQKIQKSLEKNVKQKKIFNKILMLLANQNNQLLNEKIDLKKAYQNVEKEKKDLEEKTIRYEQYLNSIIKEKESKDNKLTEVQKELEDLRFKLREKDEKLKKMEVVAQKKSKLKEITISIENQPTLKSTESKKEAIGYGNFEMDNDNISKKEEEKDSSYSENKSIKDDMVENIDVNLQDDYFVPKSKKRAEEEDESEEPVIQKPRQTKITHQKDDIVAKLSLDSIKNPAKLEVQMPKETQVNPLRNSNYNQSNSKPNHNKKSSVDDRKIKPSINIFINNSNINNNNHQVNKSPSPRQNKFKEYDRIIETHLNEIYLQKAKALGDKMKKKLKPQVARNNIHANNKHNITNETNENLTRGNTLKYGNPSNNHNIVAKINLKDINKELIINRQNEVNNNINVNQQGHNKSLSISAVTFNNELNFNSEQDILDNILDFECNKIDKKILKKEDIAIFSDQKIKDYSDVNMISKISNKNTNVSKSPLQAQRNNKKYVNNYLNSANFTQSSTNIKNLTQDNSKQNTNLNTERGNDLSKKITNPVSSFSSKIPQSVVPDNVQKSNEISTNNVDKFLNNNLNNYKGIIKKSEDRRKEDTRENKVKSRDHSPSLNRARFEKNLQKQIVKENKAKVNNNSVSKNAMDFMKEYSNLKLSTNICVKTDYSENKDLYQDKNEKQFKSRSNSKINFANEKKRIEFDKRSLDDLKEFSIDVYNENIFTVKNMMIDNRQNNPNDR